MRWGNWESSSSLRSLSIRPDARRNFRQVLCQVRGRIGSLAGARGGNSTRTSKFHTAKKHLLCYTFVLRRKRWPWPVSFPGSESSQATGGRRKSDLFLLFRRPCRLIVCKHRPACARDGARTRATTWGLRRSMPDFPQQKTHPQAGGSRQGIALARAVPHGRI